jgi:hypothetical protein
MREHAGEVERVRMIRGGLEDALVHFLRFHELLVLLEQDGEGDRLVDGQLTGRLVGRLDASPLCWS